MKEKKAGEDAPFRVLYFDTLPSTNEYAKTLAREGATEGTVIVARAQTAGHGRLDRPFVSPAGCGLYVSLLLRPAFSPALAHFITAAAAVAVAEAAEAVSGVPLRVKWVNDIYSQEGKVSGILTEAALASDGQRLAYAILGFGINLYPWGEDHSALAGPAAPLFAEAPAEEEREQRAKAILMGVLTRFWAFYKALPEKPFMEAYRARSLLMGRQVTVYAPTDKEKSRPLYTALAEGIDEEGALIVRTSDGEEKRLTAGEVTLSVFP